MLLAVWKRFHNFLTKYVRLYTTFNGQKNLEEEFIGTPFKSKILPEMLTDHQCNYAITTPNRYNAGIANRTFNFTSFPFISRRTFTREAGISVV